eukprot:357547-Chlamydomonas_euryale.AAC.3
MTLTSSSAYSLPVFISRTASPPLPPPHTTTRAHRDLVRRHDADLVQRVLLAGVHQPHHVTGRRAAVDDTELAHDAAVRVVVRVEDERAQRRVHVVRRRRHLAHNCLKALVDAKALLRRAMQDVGAVKANDLLDLAHHALRLGAWQVNLVEDGDDLEVVLQRQPHVCERLRLYAL